MPKRPKVRLCKRIASFDVGTKCFAHYVEDYYLKDIEKLARLYSSLPRKNKRRVKGYMCPQIIKIQNRMFAKSKTVAAGVFDIRSKESPDVVDLETRKNLFAHMEKHRKLWDLCSTFLIEQQYFNTFTFRRGRTIKTKGGEGNIKAIKIGEDLLAWLLINYPDREIVVFGSQFKTQILGAGDGLTKYQRKKWSVQKAQDIFFRRDETDPLEDLKKKDDVADACVQCQAYKFRALIAKF